MVSLALFFIMCFASMIGIMFKTNVAYAADLVATFHFYEIGKGSGTRTDNGVAFQYSGIKANEYSKITIGANSSVTITVSEATINAKGITSGAFYIYASGISYTWKRGSTTLKSGTISNFVNIGETSIAGSGNLVLTFTNSTGSDVSEVHFENPNYALYAAPKRSVSITAGTGVKSVYMSTSSTATSGDSSGTEYTDGTKVYGFAKLNKGYSAKSGWTLVSGTANAENAIYRVAEKTISNSQKSFGTISADVTTYTISYTLNGGTLPSGYPSSYNITTNTFSLSNPTRTGYTFAGWTGSNGSMEQTSVSIAQGSTGNKSYTANWTANQYNITYKDQGNAAFSGTHASGYPTKHTYGTATALKGASKSYYRFDGWFTNQNCTGSAITSIGATAFAADITLYAKWTPLTFTVTFDQQNGTGGTSSVIATSGLAMPSATMPTRTGYTFGGYFDGVNGSGTQYYNADGGSVTNWNKEANTTLYAYWPATPPTITSQPQGFEADYGDGGSLTVSASVATGHTIDGYQWYSSTTGSTIDASAINGANGSTLTIATTQDVGTYYYYCVVTSKEADNGNTATTTTDVVTVTLEKVDSVLTQAPAGIEELIYTSEAQELVTAGTAEGGTVWYKLGTGDYAEAIPVATDVDTYTVYYKVVGDNNHNDTAESSLQITISEVDKTALEETIATANNYVAEISETYAGVASTLSSAITNANTVYENKNVTATQVANMTDELLGKIDEAHAGVVMEKIKAIGTVTYTTDCKDKIDAAREAYDELTDDRKAIVNNYQDLTDAEAAYEAVGKIAAVDKAIFPESKDTIDTARENYDALTSDQKAKVGNYKYLTDAEVAIPVVNLIAAIDDMILPESKAAIEAAREAYDELTNAQKGRVGNYKYLTDAEAAYEVVDQIDAIGNVVYPTSKSAIEAARNAFTGLTAKQKIRVSNYKDLLKAESEYQKSEYLVKVEPVKNKIGAIGKVIFPESKDAIDAARNAYDKLTDDLKALVSNYQRLTDAEAAYEVVEKIDAILLDSKETIEAAREAYDALTPDQKLMVGNYEDLVAAEEAIGAMEADHNAASNAEALIEAIGTVTYPDSENAIKAAREAYDALTPDQKFLVGNYEDLVAAEEAFEAMKADHNAANNVEDLIEAIGTVSYPDSENDIKAAREAYDALTQDQKPLVSNYEDLVAAEEAFEAMKADHNAVSNAEALIEAIGTVTYPDSENAIKSARNAYNALTEAQKALVQNSETLTSAETEYEALENRALANAVAEKINAIGTVEFTTASKMRIDAARNAYNALTDLQKSLVENEAVLLAAEAEYEQKAKELGRDTIVEENASIKTADGTAIPADIELRVEVKTDLKTETIYEDYSNSVAAFVDENDEITAVYDVKLVRTINGVEEEIQPSDIKEGTVIIVEMAIPEEVKGKEFKILHIHSEEDVEFVEYTVDGDNIYVHVDRLSQFAFINAKTTEAKGLSAGAVTGIVIASIALAVGLFFLLFFLLKRRKKDEDKAKN